MTTNCLGDDVPISEVNCPYCLNTQCAQCVVTFDECEHGFLERHGIETVQ